jgi:hypothetical protein
MVAVAQEAKVRIITEKRVVEVKHYLNSATITSLHHRLLGEYILLTVAHYQLQR